jgi:hypothetical protein
MEGALKSGMRPSELLVAVAATAMGSDTSIHSMATISDFNLAEKSDVMGILKVAMRLALDHGTKPNELINVAVEGCDQYPARITLFNFTIEAFKNRNPALKRAVSPEEQPKKRVKTTATKDGQKHKPDVADSDSSSLSDIGGIILPLNWRECIANSLQACYQMHRRYQVYISSGWNAKVSSKYHGGHNLEALREYQGREI